MTLSIIPIPALRDNYIWCLVDPISRHAVCVDPGDATPLLQYLNQHDLTCEAILVTHHHWDHTNGLADILQHYPVPVYGPARETILEKTHPLKEGDTLSLLDGRLNLKVLDIPGHTKGHIAYYDSTRVFTGDTLFTAGCGRIFEGTPLQMYDSLQKLTQLPLNTLIYCGHEYTLNNLNFAKCVEPDNSNVLDQIVNVQELYAENKPAVPTTLQLELATNPFLRCQQRAVIDNTRLYAAQPLNDAVDIFTTLRRWKDNF